MALNAAVYLAILEAGISNSELARRILDASPDEASAHRGRARGARSSSKVGACLNALSVTELNNMTPDMTASEVRKDLELN